MINLLVKLSVNIGGLKTKLIGLGIVLLPQMLAGFALSPVRAILLFYDLWDSMLSIANRLINLVSDKK
jgi:hypothetical protein